MKAAEELAVSAVLLSGGVASNELLRSQFTVHCSQKNILFHVPEKKLCTDNGAMIAAAAAFNFNPLPWQDVTVNPELYY